MAGFRERVLEEKAQLDERLSKLGPFIESEKFETIDTRQQELLRCQYWTMQTYTDILERRLEALADSEGQ